jgi:hypothetical protein
MRGLKQLMVDGEWEDHVDTVLLSMESNMTLTHLCTDRSAMLFHWDPDWKRVDFFLRLNRANRRMLLEPNVATSLWPRVLEASTGDASSLYYMLRHKPELASGY